MRTARFILLSLLGIGTAIQIVPYGRRHSNPATSAEPAWDRQRTRELFLRACKDCHSNETDWPWYGFVAPASWLVQRDVELGRSHFNVSEWGRPENHGDEAAEMIRAGEMPPWYFLLAHPEARLSARDRQALTDGLAETFGEQADHGRESGHSH